jgi:hypothetical protein
MSNLNTRSERISLFWEIQKASQVIGNPLTTRAIDAFGLYWRLVFCLVIAAAVASFKWEIPAVSWLSLGVLFLMPAGIVFWRYRNAPAETTVERVDRLLLRYEPFDSHAFRELQQALTERGPTRATLEDWISKEREAIARSRRQLDGQRMKFTERQL